MNGSSARIGDFRIGRTVSERGAEGKVKSMDSRTPRKVRNRILNRGCPLNRVLTLTHTPTVTLSSTHSLTTLRDPHWKRHRKRRALPGFAVHRDVPSHHLAELT